MDLPVFRRNMPNQAGLSRGISNRVVVKLADGEMSLSPGTLDARNRQSAHRTPPRPHNHVSDGPS